MNIIITVRIFSDRLLFNSIFGQSFYTKVDIGQRSVVMLKQRLVRPSLRLEETVPVLQYHYQGLTTIIWIELCL